MGDLLESIVEEIWKAGPMGFEVFLKRALYDPMEGYYAKGPAIGRAGDFFTSVSTGRLFGELLAEQVAEIWERMGRPEAFEIVEQGAHCGQFAADLLGALQRRHRALCEGARYRIVEPLPELRERQRETLSETWSEAVSWCHEIEGLGAFEGVYLCNELVDAFAFRRVRFESGRWRELAVGLAEDGSLRWEAAGDCDEEVAAESALLAEGGYPEGYETEIRPAVKPWIAALCKVMRRGAALILDYGYEEAEYFEAGRREGTLRCYEGHQALDDPFENVGGRDITAHVNFSRLAAEAEGGGLEIEGLVDQHHFFIGAGRKLLEEREGVSDPGFARQFQTLTHPGWLGRSFKVLGLSRGLPSGKFSGFATGRMR